MPAPCSVPGCNKKEMVIQQAQQSTYTYTENASPTGQIIHNILLLTLLLCIICVTFSAFCQLNRLVSHFPSGPSCCLFLWLIWLVVGRNLSKCPYSVCTESLTLSNSQYMFFAVSHGFKQAFLATYDV